MASSKVRNIYGDAWKEKYQDLMMTSKQTEGQPIAASAEYIAVAWDVGGGGTVGTIKRDAINVRKPPVVMFKGHKGPVQDIEFSPFYDTLFATSSDDTTVKLWEIPQGDTDTLKQDCIADLSGHEKKVTINSFNPVADWILASGSLDATVKIWNLEAQAFEFSARLPDACFHLKWNNTGSLLATTSKDKILRILDPRKQNTVSEITAHQGAKAAKVEWLGGLGVDDSLLITSGFAKGAGREFALWDTRKLEEPIERVTVDRGAGTVTPTWDEGSSIVYFTGKGDGNIRLAELVDKSKLHFLSEFRSTTPCKAVCFLPKRAMDTTRNELARALKIEGQNIILPISFIVPRKATDFQADLFPECLAGEPALTPEKWLAGENAEPIRSSMKPDEEGRSPFQQRKVEKRNLVSGGNAAAAVNNTPTVLKKQLTRADTKIDDLSRTIQEKDTASLVLTNEHNQLVQELEEKTKELSDLRAENVLLKTKLEELDKFFSSCQDVMHYAAWQSAHGGH